MKDRIQQIMKMENLNQKEFSELTGISPATLSSIFNGRTSPTLNHAEALHKVFPRLSMPWLIFGEGDMFGEPSKDGPSSAPLQPQSASPTLFPCDIPSGERSADAGAPVMREVADDLSRPSLSGDGKGIPYIREVVKYIDKPQRRITEVRIFFDDGTYETFPGK